MAGTVEGSEVRFSPATSNPAVNSAVFEGAVSGDAMFGNVNAPWCGGRGTGTWRVHRSS